MSATIELAPDAGSMRAERAPPRTSPAYAKAWPGAPDLAVEVASPNQHRPETRKKARYYLNAGTRLVWVVWPRRQRVNVRRPGDTQPSATLGMGESLSGEDVVQGFAYPVADLLT